MVIAITIDPQLAKGKCTIVEAGHDAEIDILYYPQSV